MSDRTYIVILNGVETIHLMAADDDAAWEATKHLVRNEHTARTFVMLLGPEHMCRACWVSPK